MLEAKIRAGTLEASSVASAFDRQHGWTVFNRKNPYTKTEKPFTTEVPTIVTEKVYKLSHDDGSDEDIIESLESSSSKNKHIKTGSEPVSTVDTLLKDDAEDESESAITVKNTFLKDKIDPDSETVISVKTVLLKDEEDEEDDEPSFTTTTENPLLEDEDEDDNDNDDSDDFESDEYADVDDEEENWLTIELTTPPGVPSSTEKTKTEDAIQSTASPTTSKAVSSTMPPRVHLTTPSYSTRKHYEDNFTKLPVIRVTQELLRRIQPPEVIHKDHKHRWNDQYRFQAP